MKPALFLLFSKTFGRDDYVSVTCAISGDVQGLRARCREFASMIDLYAALQFAGLLESEFQTPLNVVRCGFSAFMEVSSHVARNLGVLFDSRPSNERAWSVERLTDLQTTQH